MRRSLGTALAGLLLMCVSSPAHARLPAYAMHMTPEEGPVDPAVQQRTSAALVHCQDGATTTPAIARCFADEFPRQDAALNRVWRTVLARVAPAERPALVGAQRRWIAARDPFCQRYSDGFRGGTIRPVIYHGCRAEQTIRRSLWLESVPGRPAKTLPPRRQTG